MKNQIFKNEIASALSAGSEKEIINSKINSSYAGIIREISDNSNIQIISKNKTDLEIEELLNELIKDHIEQVNLKRIENLEQKLINNLDESSYSELVKLKSQLNRIKKV